MSVHLSAWNNSAPTGRIFMKFDIWVFFWKSVMKIWVSLLKRITGTLYVDLRTCISCSILLTMRNVLDRSCRENHNTHFTFSKSPPKNHASYEIMRKNVAHWTGHRWQYKSMHIFWHIEYIIILLLSMTTMVTQIHLKVTWCICYLSCFYIWILVHTDTIINFATPYLGLHHQVRQFLSFGITILVEVYTGTIVIIVYCLQETPDIRNFLHDTLLI